MGNYIGIDLGTTYSAVATLDATGRPTIIENKNKLASPSGNITASCVTIRSESFVVGDQARKALQVSDNAAGRFKREMGTAKSYRLNGEDYTPTDLSALVLTEMKKIATDEVGDLSKVVVTIPANFANEAREATIQAAKKAGLDFDYIVNEPTAASLYYAFKNSASDGIYAVYDLGGGTFDISIISIKDTDVEVLASNGIARLGGDDFDKELIKIVAKKFEAETGNKLNASDYTLTEAEEDKISLSNKARIIAGGKEQNVADVTLKITQSDFEESISGLLAQAELACEATINEAGLKCEDIIDIILVGGSTRMPCVRKSVARVFGKEPVTTENPDEAVALGAALYAAIKSDGKHLSSTQKKSVSKISVQDVANHFFGTIAFSSENNESRNFIIIKKGEKLPCSVTQSFSTISDGQTVVNCRITQSENAETDPRWVKTVGEGELDELPPNRPAGQEIEVTYSYDDNQVMHCVFKDMQSGKEFSFIISQTSSEKQTSAIDKFLVD